MNIKIQITAAEMKEAVSEWLLKHKNIAIGVEQLQPTMETEGQYEETKEYMVGFHVDAAGFKIDKNKLMVSK